MECELVSSSHSKKSTGVEDDKSNTPLSYSKVFGEYLPYFMLMGMTPEQFYDGDCTLTKAYRKLYELKEQETNRHLWLQGAYIYNAIADISPILNPFAKSGTKPLPYVERPFPITKEEIKQEDDYKAKEEFERQKLRFLQMSNEINKSLNLKEDSNA